MKGLIRKNGKYILCAAAGILAFLAAEAFGIGEKFPAGGELIRNDAGKGEAVYEFYVDGLEEESVLVALTVPERQLTVGQFRKAVPRAAEWLCTRILSENPSLSEVCSDLDLVREIPEYGLSVSWESSDPEIIDGSGFVGFDGLETEREEVILSAKISNGPHEETVEIPVAVLRPEADGRKRLNSLLERAVNEDPEAERIRLPGEMEGRELIYRSAGKKGNGVLILLGFAAAGLLFLKEKEDRKKAEKVREDKLLLAYPELMSRFLILTGAGLSIRQAWNRQTADLKRTEKGRDHPLCAEMEITLNQIETGFAEDRAYAEFGRRLNLRCYTRFASLLESGLKNGGKDLRRLLETEAEEAFRQRKDIARRKGEEASAKLLAPMFLMLGVVLTMVIAPAFLALG